MPWFRRARPAHTSWLLTKTYFQMLVFWVVFLFVLPPVVAHVGDLLGTPRMQLPFARPIALTIFLLASTLGLASAYTMASRGRGTPLPLDAPSELVVTGPYAWIRNPMAVAGLTQGVAVALWLGSPMVLIYVMSGGLLWNMFVRPVEENDLDATFGQSFRDYRAAVPLWLPKLKTRVRRSGPE